MANGIKGEVAFTAGSMGAFVLVYDFNALVTIEEDLGVAVGELPAMFADGVSAKTVRTVFRIGLEAQHAPVTDRFAGDVIQQVGAATAAELIGKGFEAAFPEARKGPRKAAPTAAGTAPTS